MVEKLKTLKDCYSVIDGRCELREEAIKHIKDITGRACGQAHSTFITKRAQISWIKRFFNITGEDLK